MRKGLVRACAHYSGLSRGVTANDQLASINKWGCSHPCVCGVKFAAATAGPIFAIIDQVRGRPQGRMIVRQVFTCPLCRYRGGNRRSIRTAIV